jgi:hypothetical protein
MVKKRGLNDTVTAEDGAVIETQDAQDVTVPHVEEEDPDYANLLGTVQEIKKRPEIFGYILKGDAKATVDLNDPAKIIEYAMLSSQAFESSETLAAAFSLGAPENILIEGKTLKALCMDLGQNKISIFMEKTANHTELLKAFTPQPE